MSHTDPRPGLKKMLPGKSDMIGYIRFGDDLMYIHIPYAKTHAPEAVASLQEAADICKRMAEHLYGK